MTVTSLLINDSLQGGVFNAVKFISELSFPCRYYLVNDCVERDRAAAIHKYSYTPDCRETAALAYDEAIDVFNQQDGSLHKAAKVAAAKTTLTFWGLGN